MTAAAPAKVELRCHRCSYFLREMPHAHAAELVCIYKPGRGARVYAPQPCQPIRCDHCGWVNVFVGTIVAANVQLRPGPEG